MTGGWRIAARNLARNRRRTAVTATAIALGFAALVLLASYGAAVERFLRANAVYVQRGGHVMVFRAGGLTRAALQPDRYQLGPAEQRAVRAALEADPRVELTAPFLRGMGLAGNGCKSLPFQALGVDPAVDRRIIQHRDVLRDVPDLARPLLGDALAAYPAVEGPIGVAGGLARLLGKPRVHDDVAGAPVAAVRCDAPDVAAQLARDANVQLASTTYGGDLSAVDAEIVQVFRGTSRESEDAALLAPLEVLQRLYDTDGVTYVAAFLRDARDTHAVAAEAERRLRAEGLAVSVHTFDEMAANPYYAGAMGFFRGMALFINLLVLSVATLAMLNATTLSVVERTRELGTLRALGYRRRDLRAQFLRETALLAAVALGAGLALALAGVGLFNAAHVMIAPPGMPGKVWIFLSPTVEGIVPLAAVLFAALLAATWIAVRRPARRRIAELLVAASG